MRLKTPLQSLTMLGSSPSSSKSGAVCSNASVEWRLRPFLRPFKMKVKRHMRDLGHGQSGPYARRLVERERMAAGIRRLSRLRRFRKVIDWLESFCAFIGGTHAILESWCGHDGLAAECAQDPEDGCGSVTRVEQVAMSFDGICVGTQCQVRSVVCCYGSVGAGICGSDLGGPHQPRYVGSCAQGLAATSQF